MSGPLWGRPPSPGRLALLAALAAAVLDAGAVALFWQVDDARRVVAARLSDPGFFPPYEVWPLFVVDAKGLLAGGAALLGLGFVAALAGVGWSRRRAVGSLAGIAVVIPATIFGLAGLGIVRAARAWLTYNSSGCGDPWVMEGIWYDAFASDAFPLQTARLAILVVALLATVAVLAGARRAGAAATPRLFAPAVLFVGGLAAFAATRAEAADRRSLMPRLSPTSERLWFAPALVAAIPRATPGCAPGGQGPLLGLQEGAWFLDGVAVADPAELGRILEQKRELWKLILPNRPFPGVIVAAIPATTPLARVRPTLAVARAAGYPIVEVLEALPAASWASRTQGNVPYVARGCRVRLAPAAEERPTGTWGELAVTAAPVGGQR